jgi:ATP-dependent exoDNAse (exonuclease V) alpha subunit
MDLSREQTSLLANLEELGAGLFFITGKAGTGKSTLLRALAKQMEGKAAVVAPTGLAAVNVGGQTIHSMFGFKPGPLMNTEDHVHRYSPSTFRGRLLRKMETLIIDEVSMVRADVLDAIDYCLRLNNKSDLPFGGKRVIVVGDLLQLEPIVSRGADSEMIEHRYASPYFFDSEVVREHRMEVLELTEVHRQASDPEFLWALNEVRWGRTDVLEVFNERLGAEIDEARVITLGTHNEGVNALNMRRLVEISAPTTNYRATVDGTFERDFPTDPELMLKPGARVMFLKNAALWVNGSLGTIIACRPDLVVVELDNGQTVEVPPMEWEKVRWTWDSVRDRLSYEVAGTFTQIPLKLAWAMTIHKSQGLTFDDVRLDLTRAIFAHGQLYVALSRCRRLAGMSLTRKLKPEDLIIHERVFHFWRQMGLS